MIEATPCDETLGEIIAEFCIDPAEGDAATTMATACSSAILGDVSAEPCSSRRHLGQNSDEPCVFPC